MGGGRNLKPFVFRPKSSEEQKNKVNTSADVQFSAQSQVKSKKRSSHLQIVLGTDRYNTFLIFAFLVVMCVCVLRLLISKKNTALVRGYDKVQRPCISFI